MILIKKIFVGIAFLLNAIILEGCTLSFSDGEGNNGTFHANSDDIFMYVTIILVVLGVTSGLTGRLVYYQKKKDDENK